MIYSVIAMIYSVIARIYSVIARIYSVIARNEAIYKSAMDCFVPRNDDRGNHNDETAVTASKARQFTTYLLLAQNLS